MLVLDVLRGRTLLGQAHTGAFRPELVGRPDCDAARAFWFEPKDPLEGLDQIQVRVTGSDYYLPIRKDPIPIPPDDLIFEVVGGRNIIPQFLSVGGADRFLIQRLINESGGQVRKGSRILDWGCGCARVARHWANLVPDIEFHGCDINEQLIAWCSGNMPFGTYKTSGLLPPLPYPSNHFDVLYGISVLTHLLFDAHHIWAAEIWRVLKPGGIAVLTAQGPSLFPVIAKQIANGFQAMTHSVDTSMFVGIGRVEGSNETGNNVTRDVMEKLFHPFDMRDHRPCFGLMGIQDSYVFYKNAQGDLHHVAKLLESEMNGKDFEVEIAIPTKEFGRCSFFVGARNLVYPATVEFTVEFADSAMLPIKSATARLPEKSIWTGLEEAYSFVSIDRIPLSDGKVRLLAKCKGERALDGATLLVHNAHFL
ncbi:MAG: class I SAM-dependent methyltransferase [Pseudomonadota bacterium]|nr:class I SAM-dependent methyltransferase [Pseudomonadota bacterium]